MTTPPTPETLLAALAHTVREQLKERQAVVLPGLGALHVHHEPSHLVEDESGGSQLMPPRDVVVHQPPALTNPASDG